MVALEVNTSPAKLIVPPPDNAGALEDVIVVNVISKVAVIDAASAVPEFNVHPSTVFVPDPPIVKHVEFPVEKLVEKALKAAVPDVVVGDEKTEFVKETVPAEIVFAVVDATPVPAAFEKLQFVKEITPPKEFNPEATNIFDPASEASPKQYRNATTELIAEFVNETPIAVPDTLSSHLVKKSCRVAFPVLVINVPEDAWNLIPEKLKCVPVAVLSKVTGPVIITFPIISSLKAVMLTAVLSVIDPP